MWVGWLLYMHSIFFNLQEKQILFLENKGLFNTLLCHKEDCMIKGWVPARRGKERHRAAAGSVCSSFLSDSDCGLSITFLSTVTLSLHGITSLSRVSNCGETINKYAIW